MMNLILTLVGIYLLIGLAFGAPFVLKGVGRVDPVARQAPLIFRMLILPGVVGLWPVMLGKWIRARQGGEV